MGRNAGTNMTHVRSTTAAGFLFVLFILTLAGYENSLVEAAKAIQAESSTPKIGMIDVNNIALLSGDNFSFGIVTAGSSYTKKFSLSNSGKSTLIVESIEIVPGSGTAPGSFVVVGTTQASIAPGAKAEFELSFIAIEGGTKTAVLKIRTNDVINPDFILNLNVDVSMLNSLTISSGTLSPTFSAGIFNYSATVDQTVNTLTVSGTRADLSATLDFNPSQPMPLNEGVNTVTATVTAMSGASATYTITVTRAPSPPTFTVTDTGITRKVTINKPLSCLNASLYYTTNGIDITIPANRIPYTDQLTVTGLGVQVEFKAIAVLDNSTSPIATATTTIINYPSLGLNQAPAQLSLGDVNAAIAINGTLYYSNDNLRVKKSDSPYGSSTALAGGVEFIDLDGNGLNARFDGIMDMTTDGVNLYILTYTKLRKLDLSTMNVSTIASLPSDYSGSCSATTDGTYVYVQTFYRTSSSMGRFKISDGTFMPIVVDTGLIYTGIAWDGTTLYCSICPSNGINPGSLEHWTYTSSWLLGVTTTLVNSGTRGVAVDSSNLYLAHYSVYSDQVTLGPVTRTPKISPGDMPTYLGYRGSYSYGRKLFTDGIWLYGYGSSTYNGFKGPLYIIKKNP